MKCSYKRHGNTVRNHWYDGDLKLPKTTLVKLTWVEKDWKVINYLAI